MTLSCFEGLAYVFFMLAINAARYPYRPPHFYDQFTEDDDRPRTPLDERTTDAPRTPD